MYILARLGGQKSTFWLSILGNGDRTMNLNCPKCNSEDTQKLTLVMNQGGMAEKSAKLGMAYGYNIMLPLMTVVIAFLMGLMFGLFNIVLGLIAFVGVLFA